MSTLSNLHPVFQQIFEDLALPSIPTDRESQSPRGQVQTISPELVRETLANGTVRVARLCVRHQWASRFVEDLENALPCPLCRCEIEEQQGRLRYATLHTRLVLGY